MASAVKCPYCKTKIKGTPGAGAESQGHDKAYGSPFRVCPKCGKSMLDKRYREIAVDGLYWDDKLPVSLSNLIGLALAVVFLLVVQNATEGEKWLMYTLAGLVILSGIYQLFNRGKHKAALEKEKAASIGRLKDPEYVQRLINAGYKLKAVPADKAPEPENNPPVSHIKPAKPSSPAPPVRQAESGNYRCAACGEYYSEWRQKCSVCETEGSLIKQEEPRSFSANNAESSGNYVWTPGDFKQ